MTYTRICLPNILTWKSPKMETFHILKSSYCSSRGNGRRFEVFPFNNICAFLFVKVYLSLCYKRFLNTTNRGKIAYTTNQNWEMKTLRVLSSTTCLKVQYSSFSGIWTLNTVLEPDFQFKFNLHLRKRERINKPCKNGFSKTYII